MPRTVEQLIARVQQLTEPGARGRLLARGLARGFIWRNGQLPPASPAFGATLTADLLDHGFALLMNALDLKETRESLSLTSTAFLNAAEAIEAAVRRGDPTDPSRGFHLVVAACAFHLAGFAARAYCLLPSDLAGLNLSSSERALALLLRRSLRSLREACFEWLQAAENSDVGVAERLLSVEGAFDAEDALATAFARNFHRAMALFDSALHNGRGDAYEASRELLISGAEAASEARVVPTWWAHTLARYLIEDLWSSSLHQMIPVTPESDAPTDWNRLRDSYISLLESRDVSEVDLWPSQLEAAKRSLDPTDDLIVALPTSAGKTRIAELCILRALSLGTRVVYVTPLRALSSQVERVLGRVFRPLGFSVSSLYGASGVAVADVGTLKSSQIVVATPEKLDFAIRQDATVLDDVGLVVLDEGHMIGLGSREIRYEVLVQRLLRRPDAANRRLVCLSAIFSDGEAFNDFSQWLRSDQQGDAIRSEWRPTRQRTGLLRWYGTHGRLDVGVQGEQPFIPKFVVSQPPQRRRRKPYPQDQKEFVVAAAQRFVEDGTKVLIYCPTRKSVESLARLCLRLTEQGYVTPLLADEAPINKAIQVGAEWLGADHVAVQALRLGIGVHHGSLPRQFLHEVEHLLNERVLPIAISSPTLAQGVDLSCSTLIFHSIYRNGEIIPASEFSNVIGRAGRAFVDLDGLTVLPVFEWRQKLWRDFGQLVAASKRKQLESGLLLLIKAVAQQLGERTGQTPHQLLDHVTNEDYEWVPSPATTLNIQGAEEDEEQTTLESLLADLDSAILAMAEDLECSTDALADSLDEVLRSSLWFRRLARLPEAERTLQRAVLQGRAKWIWQHSIPAQRKGYFAAGIGHAAGQFLDDRLDSLLSDLIAADSALQTGDVESAVGPLLNLADVLMSVEPFAYPNRPDHWRDLLAGWIRGIPLNALFKTQTPDEIGFIQQGVVYHLVWGVEAVRVHAQATGKLLPDTVTGLAAMALMYGVPSRAGCLLLESGLSSRTVAQDLPVQFGSGFADHEGMHNWLRNIVPAVQDAMLWPDNPAAMRMWREYADVWSAGGSSSWTRSTHEIPVFWTRPESVETGSHVRVTEHRDEAFICLEDFTVVGRIEGYNPLVLKGSLRAEVHGEATVRVHRFGPPLPA